VDGAAIPPVTEERDIMKLWMNLRPHSLNYWLANRSGRAK
jgi:hypothetical protein